MAKAGLLVGSLISYIVVALFNAILVVAKETNKALKSGLASTFGHHWIGHGILTIIVFVVVALIIMAVYRRKEPTEKLLSWLTIATVIFTLISFIIIAGFYLTHL